MMLIAMVLVMVTVMVLVLVMVMVTVMVMVPVMVTVMRMARLMVMVAMGMVLFNTTITNAIPITGGMHNAGDNMPFARIQLEQ